MHTKTKLRPSQRYLIERWIAAMESGAYQKSDFQLVAIDPDTKIPVSYCAYGVLCDIVSLNPDYSPVRVVRIEDKFHFYQEGGIPEKRTSTVPHWFTREALGINYTQADQVYFYNSFRDAVASAKGYEAVIRYLKEILKFDELDFPAEAESA